MSQVLRVTYLSYNIGQVIDFTDPSFSTYKMVIKMNTLPMYFTC